MNRERICQFCVRKLVNEGSHFLHEKSCQQNPHRIQRKKSPLAHAKKGSIPWNKGKIFVPRKAIGQHGGHRHGSGRGKKGWIRDIFCDSSWELAYVLYCTDHNISIKRNTQKFKYHFKDLEHWYIPDFIVDGMLIEVKGYKTPQWEAKIKAVPFVTIVDEISIQPYLKYAQDKYGKDFIKQYSTEGTEVGSSN